MNKSNEIVRKCERKYFDPVCDLTVVIPTYNRTQYFHQYLAAGYWDNVPIRLVCDGCDADVIEGLKTAACDRPISVLDYQPNRGVAHAVGVGVRSVETSHFMFCGDDDYNVDYDRFLEEAAEITRSHDDVLFVTLPEIHTFSDDEEPRLQYDRRLFHGKTGAEVLSFLVQTGEMRALVAGSLFRTREVIDCLPEPFFKVSEDFVMLARLCARYPERRIYVTESGRRMRRKHAHSLSAAQAFSVEKALMNLISMVVGGHCMYEAHKLHRAQLVRILLDRGALLERKYGFGKQTAATVAALLLDQPVYLSSEEARGALQYLKDKREVLPVEFAAMLSPYGCGLLLDQSQPNPRTSTNDAVAPYLFVGGGARTGTTLMQTLLCQAETTNPMVPEAHYLRCLLSAFHLALGSLELQIPLYFSDSEDFRRFNGDILKQYLERTRHRFPGASCLVLKDPEMTKSFPYLFDLCPRAQFICMIRDPRDTVASLIQVGTKMLVDGRRDMIAIATQQRDVRRLCQYLKSFYEPVLKYEHTGFWDRILFVRYEDLVSNPEGVLEEIGVFTGLNLLGVADNDILDTGSVNYSERIGSPWYSVLYGKGIAASRVGIYTETLSLDETRTTESACAELFELFQYEPFLQQAAGTEG